MDDEGSKIQGRHHHLLLFPIGQTPQPNLSPPAPELKEGLGRTGLELRGEGFVGGLDVIL